MGRYLNCAQQPNVPPKVLYLSVTFRLFPRFARHEIVSTTSCKKRERPATSDAAARLFPTLLTDVVKVTECMKFWRAFLPDRESST